jgi:hypothetical protein
VFCCLLIIFPLIQVSAARQQIQGGTVVVIFYSHDKVIFAADSRRAVTNQQGVIVSKRDNECKLLALNNRVIVATAGKIVAEDVDLEKPGLGINSANMALQLAREAASGTEPMEQDPAKVLAKAWLNRMVPFVREQVRHPYPPGTELTQALFAGRLPDGTLRLYMSTVIWDGQQIASGRDADPVPLNPSEPFLPPLAKEKSMEVFSNLVNTNVPSSFHPEWDRDAAKAVYLAARVRGTPPRDETIGGRIDAVELQANGTITWVRRKDYCRAD